MNAKDMTALLPLLILAGATVVLMLVIAFYRNHRVAAALSLLGLAASLAALLPASFAAPRSITALLVIDPYALYYQTLVLAATLCVAALSFSYLEKQGGHREEFYLLLLLAALGAAVLAASRHFASLFLGIELLSVSLYALAAYLRHSSRSVEAGVKYLILAAVSSAFLLFGMALVYAETGTLEFSGIAARLGAPDVHHLTLLAGTGLIVVGLGFKLAVVPFHLWTPDVYEGAPAPVTAFIATVSKGAVFAVALRYFSRVDIHGSPSLFAVLAVIAVLSMFIGNLLALLQKNVKRLLAYSSISHLGYLLVALLAAGPLAASAAAFYLAAYFITTLGAFGCVTVLSTGARDADNIDDYLGLAWRRPMLGGVFTVMLLSLAGIPLTAGFIGKFYVVAAGAGSGLWLLVIALVINSALGLFYYLRVVAAFFAQTPKEQTELTLSRSGSTVLAGLTIALVGLGAYPQPLIALIEKAVQAVH